MYWSRCTSFPPKLKERDWKVRSTKVDAGNPKHELLNWLWSILALNVLKYQDFYNEYISGVGQCSSHISEFFFVRIHVIHFYNWSWCLEWQFSFSLHWGIDKSVNYCVRNLFEIHVFHHGVRMYCNVWESHVLMLSHTDNYLRKFKLTSSSCQLLFDMLHLKYGSHV
jgi:hypothetical protein